MKIIKSKRRIAPNKTKAKDFSTWYKKESRINQSVILLPFLSYFVVFRNTRSNYVHQIIKFFWSCLVSFWLLAQFYLPILGLLKIAFFFIKEHSIFSFLCFFTLWTSFNFSKQNLIDFNKLGNIIYWISEEK